MSISFISCELRLYSAVAIMHNAQQQHTFLYFCGCQSRLLMLLLILSWKIFLPFFSQYFSLLFLYFLVKESAFLFLSLLIIWECYVACCCLLTKLKANSNGKLYILALYYNKLIKFYIMNETSWNIFLHKIKWTFQGSVLATKPLSTLHLTLSPKQENVAPNGETLWWMSHKLTNFWESERRTTPKTSKMGLLTSCKCMPWCWLGSHTYTRKKRGVPFSIFWFLYQIVPTT